MNIMMIDSDYDFCNSFCKYFKNNGNINITKILHSANDATFFLENNKDKIDLVMFDFNVSDINLHNLFESIPKDCDLVAFSKEKIVLQQYINSPNFQRVFEKPLPFSTISDYLNLKYSSENFDQFKSFILQTLSELGFNLKHSGTNYLMEGVLFAAKNKTKKLSDIYSFLAAKYSTSSKIVGWSVNNAINHAVKSGKEQKIQNFFKIYDNRKLTAKYIINYFINSRSQLE